MTLPPEPTPEVVLTSPDFCLHSRERLLCNASWEINSLRKKVQELCDRLDRMRTAGIEVSPLRFRHLPAFDFNARVVERNSDRELPVCSRCH